MNSQMMNEKNSYQIPVAIVGAGAAGVQLLEEVQSNPNSHYCVKCFFDDDPVKHNSRIHGVDVVGNIKDLPDYLKVMKIWEVIVAIPSIEEPRRQEILSVLSGLDRIKVTIVPSVKELIDQRPIRSQLRDIQVEDLLGREPVQLDPLQVDAFLSGKVVMVTGGGGSIGSELCRQIAKHRPRQLIIIDIYENNAYDIQQELLYQYENQINLAVEIASVRDAERIRELFWRYRPNIVFHAAAHKHVPLMENCPQEAIRNNVFGTWNLVQAADACGVEKFVQISTDKAVNPTSVMGATKRLCEMILQSMERRSSTSFSAVRFGNVLGSNGSVVPLFKRQIAAGGPVTVTDRRIIRYFMTISEAVQLVLQAGAMARQNELYVLDMGQPVKIVELAEQMIRLSGYVPYLDINIVETGLRPGEKLYEEPLIVGRRITKTNNSKIYIEYQPPISAEELQEKLEKLKEVLKKGTTGSIREVLHQIVPTFCEPERVNQTADQSLTPGSNLLDWM